ncbi:twin-arginine translocase subunit TatC [Heliobacterium undosum]|uniref:Sec-independent protein translocase protein TatC n=1 Tax=Heliomicrobium undosum TaxID=121734 RepID=A0A845KZW1_9FIRM|nr:twin-arginine translocase subunit TatC [Heliomicrobium undosum]MZP28115.1 twin-arginine translocase subunit TatC [Heliomicrobium undosum]
MTESNHEEKTMPLTDHLEELRTVLIWALVAAVAGTAVAYNWNQELIALLTKPMGDLGIKPVIVRPAEGFFASVKVSFFAGLILASPVILWKIWSFVMPALYPHERKWVYIILPISVLLLVSGVVFAFYTVYPIGVTFLITFGDFTPMISISEYLSFALWFILPFGLVFQMPLVIMFLVRLGIVDHHFLAKYRRYAILIMFVVAAIFTPTPDVISQTLMAAPMYLLYEISIWIARWIRPKKTAEADAAGEGALRRDVP